MVREGYARDSPSLGALEPGTEIEVLESRTNEQGQQRVRFMFNGREGWTSVVSGAGQVILEPVPNAPTPPRPHAAAGGGGARARAVREARAAVEGADADADAEQWESAGFVRRVGAQLIDNGFVLVLTCIVFGDVAFEQAGAASAELASTIGLALVAQGQGRPDITPAHVHQFVGSELMGYLMTQLLIHVLYDGVLAYHLRVVIIVIRTNSLDWLRFTYALRDRYGY
jgi:hypothetical protein